jgi:hypothetical protein
VGPATAGLIGAAIGAAAGVSASLVSAYFQRHDERLAFQRQRKAEAYGSAVEHLFRAAARRTAEGKPVLSQDDQGQWFIDLVDGLQSLTAVVAYAGQGWRTELLDVLQHYGIAVWELTQKSLEIKVKPPEPHPFVGLKPFLGKWEGDVPNTLWEAAKTVQEIAMFDMLGYKSRHQVQREFAKKA